MVPDVGVGDGLSDGVVEGVGDGLSDGAVEGVGDGSSDGVVEGVGDGSSDGVAVGIGDGSSDGVVEGVGDGLSDGVVEGVGDGLSDGVVKGVGDGLSDGVGVTSGSYRVITVHLTVSDAAIYSFPVFSPGRCTLKVSIFESPMAIFPNAMGAVNPLNRPLYNNVPSSRYNENSSLSSRYPPPLPGSVLTTSQLNQTGREDASTSST